MLRVNYASTARKWNLIAWNYRKRCMGYLCGQPASRFSPRLPVSWLKRAIINETYWGQNIRHSVQFTDAMQRLIADGFTTFLEISHIRCWPHRSHNAWMDNKTIWCWLRCAVGKQKHKPCGTCWENCMRMATQFNGMFSTLMGDASRYPLIPGSVKALVRDQNYSRPAGLPHGASEDIHPLLGTKIPFTCSHRKRFPGYFTSEHPCLLAITASTITSWFPGPLSGNGAGGCGSVLWGYPCTVEEFLIQEALALPENQVAQRTICG